MNLIGSKAVAPVIHFIHLRFLSLGVQLHWSALKVRMFRKVLVFFQPSIANATNIDTLLVATEKEDKMTAPPEALQDKIGFVFNNLSQLNLQTKVCRVCLVI